jgi:hypothetical protein
MAEREGVLQGIAETQIAGIPVGAAVTGALVAGLADGVISLIPTKLPNVVSRGIAALACVKWGPRVFGTTAAQTAGLFLAYDAMQEVFDFRGLTRGLFKKVTGSTTTTTAGLGAEEEIELPPELLGDEEKLVAEGAERGAY